MDCFAHRGYAEAGPENTVPAARAAARTADAVEVDVRRCGSGELVVVHDETVDRVTDERGRVDAFDADALGALSVLGSDAGIPTLEALLDGLPAAIAVNVELKERGLATDLAALVADRDREILVSAFDPGALREVRAASDLSTALLFAAEPARSIETATVLDCAAVHPHHELCDPDFVARAHEAGLTVNAWTVRDEAVARRLADAGVDGLIVDHPQFCP